MSKVKFKKGVYNFFIEMFIIFFIVIIFCKISRLNEDKIIDNVYLKDLISNWSNKPIKELYLAKKDENCEKNFLNYQWEGVSYSCDCKSSNNGSVRGNIYVGRCSVFNSLLGCFSTKNIIPQYVHMWKNAKICIKEHQIGYSDTMTILGNKCPKKYILCGTDSKDFSICYPKSHGCPINFLKFSNLEKKQSDKITHTLKLNDDWYIHYSNKYTNNSLLVDIKYTEGRVCIDPSQKNIKNSHLKYKKSPEELEIEKEKEKRKIHAYCSTKIGKGNFDERYFHLDSNSKFKFYTDNKLMDLVERLPQLNSQDLISQTGNIYFRSYIHWSPYCRQDESLNPYSMLKDISELVIIDTFYPFIQIYLLYIFVVNLTIMIFSWVMIFKKNNDQLEKLLNKNELLKNYPLFSFSTLINYQQKICFILTKILIFSIAALMCGLFLNIYISEKNTHIIDKFISQKCGDIITNETFIQIAKHINVIIIGNYHILVYTIIMFGLIILKTI